MIGLLFDAIVGLLSPRVALLLVILLGLVIGGILLCAYL